MSRQQRLQAVPRDPQREQRDAHVPARRCYSAAQIIGFLGISERTFFRLKRRGKLPFLEVLRVGGSVRYRADLVDRFLAGEWRIDSDGPARRHFFGRRKAS